MSTFGVYIKKISTVWTHPNADKLDLAKVEGMEYQFVVGRGEFKAGDDVVYFQIDSVLPDVLIQNLGLTGRLSGKEKNRVKTVRLRKEISQGLVAKPEQVMKGFPHAGTVSPDEFMGFLSGLRPDNLAEFMGVTKYDPPPVVSNAGLLKPLPEGLSAYDLESCDNFPNLATQFMDMDVFVTEKVEGMNFSVTVNADGKVFVNQRNYTIEEVPGVKHGFWEIAEAQGVIRFAKGLSEGASASVTVYGEYLGPGSQGNIYGLEKNKVLLFDVMVNGKYLEPNLFLHVCEAGMMETVPVIARGRTLREVLGGKTIRDFSNGKSALKTSILREGIVVKPMYEFRDNSVGRAVLKQRSPDYLAESDT